MRIMHVVPYFYPAWGMGGTPRAVYELALAQRSLGHDVVVVTTDVKSPGETLDLSHFDDADSIEETGPDLFVRHRGLEIVYCRSRAARFFSKVEAYLIPGLLRRLSAIAEGRLPDVIHIHEFRSGLSLSAAALARRHQIPLVASTHGSLFSPTAGRWKTAIKRVFDFTLGRWLISQITCFHAVSRQEADDIRRLQGGQKAIRIIPHGFTPPTQLPRKHRMKASFPALLFLGRVHPVKGLETLLEAWLLVRRRYPHAALLLLGQGDRSYVRTLASRFGLTLSDEPEWEVGKAVYGGHVAPAVVADRLAQATCLVVPSSYEVWGLVILEALAAGSPVVATNICGCLEHLDDSSGVVVVPPGDATLLAEALKTVIATPQTPLPPSANLSWETVAREMTQSYSTAASGLLIREIIV